MGLSLVWVAVQGLAPEDVLDFADLEDTGEPDPWFEADYTGGEIADGWYVIVSGDLSLVEPGQRLADWSSGARLVAAVVHEETKTALATEWVDGRQVWSVYHDGGGGGDTLEVDGDLPAAFEAIRARLTSGSGDVLDAPLELAEAVTGFRHDTVDEDAGFTALEAV